MQWMIAFVAAAVVFGILDAFWLRWAVPNLYEPAIGNLLAEKPNVGAAGAFYFIYIAGMTYFGIRPGVESGSAMTALINGALVGGLCYATFTLTSQAVMKEWATHVSIADILWGTFATGVTSAIACWIVLRFAP